MPRDRPPSRALLVGGALALMAATLALYAPVADFPFLQLDDADYVAENAHVARGLTRDGLVWAFTSSHAANWHPLTWLSHMLDVELFGLDPGPHHLVSAGLHALAAALLFVVLARTTARPGAAALVAALFAWHPLRVESVAWLAERKDVLSAALWMLALLAHAGWAARPSARRYALVVLALAAGLLAKPMVVTLPLVLLLLDAWPLERARGQTGARRWTPLVVEKLPLLLPCAATAVVTVLAQQRDEAIRSTDIIPLGARATNALVSVVVYLRQTVWPEGLAAFYPHPAYFAEDPVAEQAVPAALSGLLLAALTLGAWRARRRAPALLVGWLWFCGTLVPVLGLVQVGNQAHADRYTYLPSVGLLVALVYGLPALLPARARGPLLALALAALLACPLVTRAILPSWRDDVTLFERALEHAVESALAHAHLGLVHERRGDWETAAEHYARAAALRPDFAAAHNNLGMMQSILERPERAEASLRRAIALDEGLAAAHANLAGVLAATGRPAEAEAAARRAIALDPSHASARNLLALLLARGGALEPAIEQVRTALASAPDEPALHANLGAFLMQAGDAAGAARAWERALHLDPGRGREAQRLAWLRATHPEATLRDGERALALAERARALLGGDDPRAALAHAAACAETGRWEEAEAALARATALAAGTPLPGLAEARRAIAAREPVRATTTP